MNAEISFVGLTKPQIAALGNVAFGGHGAGVHRKTLKKLVERGLIEPVEQHGRDALGTFTWLQYEMPIHVHIRFCAFCETWPSEGPED